MKKKLLSLVAGSMLLVPSLSNAVGLGSVRSYSNLNEKLSAEIPVLSVRKKGKMTASLASNSEFSQRGVSRSDVLRDLKFKLVERGGRIFVKVSSKKRITAPYLSFILRLTTPEGVVSREYSIFLDPKGRSKKKSLTRASGKSKPYQPSKTIKTKRTIRATPKHTRSATNVAEPKASGKSGRYGPIRNGETLWTIANHTRPSSLPVRTMLRAIKRANRSKLRHGLLTGSFLTIPTLDGSDPYNGGYAPMPASVVKHQKGVAKKKRRTKKRTNAKKNKRSGTNRKKIEKHTKKHKARKTTQRKIGKPVVKKTDRKSAVRPKIQEKTPSVQMPNMQMPAVKEATKPLTSKSAKPKIGEIEFKVKAPEKQQPIASTVVKNPKPISSDVIITPTNPKSSASATDIKEATTQASAKSESPDVNILPTGFKPIAPITGAAEGKIEENAKPISSDVNIFPSVSDPNVANSKETPETLAPIDSVGLGLPVKPVVASNEIVPSTAIPAPALLQDATKKLQDSNEPAEKEQIIDAPKPVETIVEKPQLAQAKVIGKAEPEPAKLAEPKPAEEAEPSFIDKTLVQLEENAPIIGGGVGGAAIIGGIIWFALGGRKKNKKEIPILTEESMPVLLGDDGELSDEFDNSDFGDFDDELYDTDLDDNQISVALDDEDFADPSLFDTGDILDVTTDTENELEDDLLDVDIDFTDDLFDSNDNPLSGVDDNDLFGDSENTLTEFPVVTSETINTGEADEIEDESGLDFDFGDDTFEFDDDNDITAEVTKDLDNDSSLDFSFDDDDTATEAVDLDDDTIEDLDFSFDALQESIDKTDTVAAGADDLASDSDDDLDFSFDLDLDLDSDDSADQEISDSDDGVDFSFDSSTDEPKEYIDDGLDFSFDSFADADDEPNVDELENEVSVETVSSMQMKLDLASSFLSIGQNDRARDLLTEVTGKGSTDQIEKAKELLETIS